MGSPLVVADTMKGKLVKGSPTEDLLVGIKSFGTSDPEGKTCAVYTSVSFFRTWIMKTIGGKTKPSRCMLVPQAEPEKEHDPVLQQPEPTSPVPEAESEPVTESTVPEAESEPVTESPVPETKSEAGDQQLIDEFRSLTEEQQIEVGGFHSHSCRLMYVSSSQRMVEAIKIDDDKTASALLQAGLDPNAEKGDSELQMSEDSRFLHLAARVGAPKCAEVRITSSAVRTCPVHLTLQQSDDGWTSVQVLLESGSDVDAATTDRGTALIFACYYGKLDVVKVISKTAVCLASRGLSNRSS